MGKKEQEHALDARAARQKSAEDVAAELLDAVVRAGGWVYHVRSLAEQSGSLGELMVPELLDMQERFGALHLVTLVAGGWCASERCGKRLTDPTLSESGARHCRECRIGWVLEQRDGAVRAIAHPWPARAAAEPA